jgi:hypothetical protein
MIQLHKATGQQKKVEYGDFQTPLDLAKMICLKLIELGINPDIIVEPTCGVGNFIEASSHLFPSVRKIIGVEVNRHYIGEMTTKNQFIQDQRIELQQADFFRFDWLSYINRLDGHILVLGNLPWVTNSQQGNIGGGNLPKKNNFQNHNGLDAVTGKSNFDISEWMLIQIVQWLQGHNASLAILCKVSVARKLLNYLHSKNLNLNYCATYRIDTKKYFDANVEACLLFCKFDTTSKNYFCDVFNSLESLESHQIGYRNNLLIRDVASFDKLSSFYTVKSGVKWRSGIKHDCSSIMELRKIDCLFVNGIGETVELEDRYLFPLLKGSDIAQGRISNTDRYVIVPQRFIGESTESIRKFAPKTWQYLESHSQYLENRKSKIYEKNPRFSIFGVGEYTFLPWKIAICGLYKKLEFQLIGQICDRNVVFDDTVYFISFDNEQMAQRAFQILSSPSIVNFYSSLIFWDEKRPIKSSILNTLDIYALLKLGN